MASQQSPDSIITLNVGGEKFSTSKHTLTWIPDSFFSSLLSGRIPTVKDDSGAIFIDRDPKLFRVILNYLRSKQVDLQKDISLVSLKHEAEYYGLIPLVKRLTLCDELEQSTCGDVLFHGYLPAPMLPLPESTASLHGTLNHGTKGPGHHLGHSRNISEPPTLPSRQSGSYYQGPLPRPLPTMEAKFQVPALLESPQGSSSGSGMNRANVGRSPPSAWSPGGASGHSRTSSADYARITHGRHSKKNSGDITKQIRADLYQLLKHHQQKTEHAFDPLRVRLIRGHHNWIAVGYAYSVCCFRMKDSQGWQQAYCSPRMESLINRIALNAKFGSQSTDKMLAAALENHDIHLWALGEHGSTETKIGVFSLNVSVDTLFFIGNQLVALSKTGKIGIWHSMTQNWQVQDVFPISSYDTAGSFLLMGCENGSIYYIDMQKFPLRMKDNDLLVTELYRDPSPDVITAISVYLTPKTNLCGNWIEIAYGTSGGVVRVIVQHPETVGHGPQLFQTFTVHTAPITRVALTTGHLISVCSEYNHVRSWSVTRFRGMISTQPGSTPVASFKVLTLEAADGNLDPDAADSGPFGDQDGEQLFVQKIVPETDQLFVRLASNGERICVIKSVDGSSMTGYLVHECEGSNRMGSRPRRYLFTGHSNGSIQMWDLTTAMDSYQKKKEIVEKHGPWAIQPSSSAEAGPTPGELLQLIDECEITCNSLSTTPCSTPWNSSMHIPGLLQH